MEILKLWDIILRWRKVFIAIVLVTVCVPVVGTFLTKPVYKFRSKVWVKYQDVTPAWVSNSLPSNFGKFSYASSDNLADTFVKLIQSRPVVEGVIKKLDLRDKKGTYFDADSFANPGYLKKTLTQKIGVEAVQMDDAELWEIKAYSTDIKTAVDIANYTADEFLALFNEVSQRDRKEAQIALQAEITRVRNEWYEIEKQRMEFRERKLAVDMDKQKSDMISEMTALRQQRDGIQMSIEGDKATLASLEEALKKQGPASPESRVEFLTSLSTYKSQLYTLEQSLSDKLTQYTEFHPTVVSLKAQIDYTKEAIKSALVKSLSPSTIIQTSYFDTIVNKYGDAFVDLATQTAKKQGIEATIKRLGKDQQALIEKDHEYSKISIMSDQLKSVLSNLITQMENVKIGGAIMSSNANIIERAVMPDDANVKNYKYFPNKKLTFIIALFLGVFLALATVLFLDYIDDTFKSRGEVEQYLKRPVLVTLPDRTTFSIRGTNEPK